jgi:hypothetical protein
VDQWLTLLLPSSVTLLIRSGIGGMLVLAGAIKIRGGHERFRDVLEGYAILPGWAVSLISPFVPWIEMVVGLGMLLGVLWPYPAVAASGLLTTFALALAINVIRGRSDLTCGCFGGIRSRPLTWRTVAVRTALAFACVAVAFAPTSWSTERFGYVVVFGLAWLGAWALLRALSLSAEGQGVGR